MSRAVLARGATSSQAQLCAVVTSDNDDNCTDRLVVLDVHGSGLSWTQSIESYRMRSTTATERSRHVTERNGYNLPLFRFFDE
jgi:hypothetical protein